MTSQSSNCAICCEKLCTSKIVTINVDILKQLEFLALELDTVFLQDLPICNDCYEKIQEAYKFKILYLNNLPNNNIQRSDMCEICKNIVNSQNSIKLSELEIDIKVLSSDFNIENVKALQNSKICFSCHISFTNFNAFLNLLSVNTQDETMTGSIHHKQSSSELKIDGTNKIEIKQESSNIDTEMCLKNVYIKEEQNVDYVQTSSEYKVDMEKIKTKQESSNTDTGMELDHVYVKEEPQDTHENKYYPDYANICKNELDLKTDSAEVQLLERIQHYSAQESESNTAVSNIPEQSNISQNTVNGTRMVKCDICGFQTNRNYVLKRHMLTHKNDDEITLFSCSHCDFKSKHKGSVSKHLIVHNNRDEMPMFKCEICDYQSIYKHIIKRHMIVHKSVDEIEMYQCNYCEFETKHKYYINRHMSIHKDLGDTKKYKCDICSFETRHKHSLKSHTQTHFPVDRPKIYACDFCNFRSARKGNLTKHMIVHKQLNDDEKFQCYTCGFRTLRKCTLAIHVLIHKNKEQTEIFTCDLCEYKTYRKSSLTRHMIVHQGVKLYRCDNTCECQVKSENSIDQCMPVNKDDTELLFNCECCEFKTKSQNCMNNHMNKHNKFQTFKCQICEFETIHKNSLKRHTIAVHKNMHKTIQFEGAVS